MCQKYFQWLSIFFLSSFSLSLKAGTPKHQPFSMIHFEEQEEPQKDSEEATPVSETFTTKELNIVIAVKENGHINTSEEHNLIKRYLTDKYREEFTETASELYQKALKLPKKNRDKKLFFILSHSFKTPLSRQDLIRKSQGYGLATLSPEKEQSNFKPLWTLYQNPEGRRGEKRIVNIPASCGGEHSFYLKLYPENSEENALIKEAQFINTSLPLEEPPPRILKITTKNSKRVFPAILKPFHLGSLEFTLGKMSFWNKERRAKVILYEGLKILARYEKMGLIHQNITPRNLIFTEGGDIIFRSFRGAFLLEGKGEQTFPLSGTLHYHAPEQLLERDLGSRDSVLSSKEELPRRDIFSLGLVIAEILLGESFFSSRGFRHTSSLGDQYAHFCTLYNSAQEFLKSKVEPGKKDYIWAIRDVQTDYYDGSQDVQDQLLFLARFRGETLFPLLWKMLHPDPSKRISASEALKTFEKKIGNKNTLNKMKGKIFWKAWERLHEKKPYPSSSLQEHLATLEHFASSGIKDLQADSSLKRRTRMYRALIELGL